MLLQAETHGCSESKHLTTVCMQDKKSVWFKGRKTSIVKAHMLLLAHLDRERVPANLAADHKFVVTKCILLLEEMIKIAQVPRVQVSNLVSDCDLGRLYPAYEPPIRGDQLQPAAGGDDEECAGCKRPGELAWLSVR